LFLTGKSSTLSLLTLKIILIILLRNENRDYAMTLAIAIKYPFGKLSDALVSLSRIRQVQYRQAIIFVTDSRWSYENPIMYEDFGAKIHEIDRSTVVAYSGDVAAAEHCIEALKTKVNNPSKRRIDVVGTFRRTYSFQKRNRPDVKRVLLLLGKYLKSGDTKLIYLESPDFVPVDIEGIKGIGNNDAFNDVIKEVGTIINDISIYEGTEKDYFTVAVYFIDAMCRLALHETSYNDIGGPIQYRILDHKGVSTSQISYTSDPTGKTGDWHRTTAETNEVTTYRKRWNLDPNYLHSRSFGLQSYCD